MKGEEMMMYSRTMPFLWMYVIPFKVFVYIVFSQNVPDLKFMKRTRQK